MRHKIGPSLDDAEFRALVENIPGAVYRCAADGEWTMAFISDAIEEITGYPASDFIGNRVRSFNSIVHPDDRTRDVEQLKARIAGGDGLESEFRICRADGSVRWVFERARPVRDETGTVAWIDGTILDVTERVEAQGNFRQLLDHAPDAMIIADASGAIIYANRQVEKLLGHDPAGLVGQGVETLIPARFRDRHAARREQFGANPKFRPMGSGAEFRARTAEGREIPVEISLSPIEMAGGAFVAAAIRDVSERVRAAERLRAGEERLGLVVSATGDGIYDWNVESNAHWVSPRFRELMGDGPDSPLGTLEAWHERVHPEDRARVMGAVNDALAGRSTLRIEYRVRTGEGRYRWFDDRAGVVGDSTGGALRMVGSIQDITERKHAERALEDANRELRESETRLRNLMRNVPGVVYRQRPGAESVYEFVSEGARDLLGYEPQDLVGRSHEFVCHPDDWEEGQSLFLDCLERNVAYVHEYRVVRADGAVRWVSERARGVRSDDGHLASVNGILFDVTERKQAEIALREHEARLEAAQRIARLGYWRWSAETHKLELSEGFREIYGLRPGKKLDSFEESHAFIHPDDRERVRRHDRALGTEIGDFSLEYRIVRPDGEVRHIHETASAERDAEGRAIGYNGTIQDVTGRKATEAQLAQAQKMEAVGQLTGGIAHDFNNLLGVILGNLDLLEWRAGEREKLGRQIDAIRGAAKRGALLTQGLLTFSRSQALVPEFVDLNRLVAGTMDILTRSLGETITIETELADGLISTVADPNQLENALLNLAINARDAMPEGGALRIETANAELDPEAAAKAGVAPGLYASLAVTDTGLGMSAETLEHAIEPFFTTKDVGKGSGLGLSMVHGFVAQSGGQVAIESGPGRGTTVTLYLPRFGKPAVESLQPEAGAERPHEEPAGGSGETVLVVEDNAEVGAAAREMLRSHGYRVLGADDGPSALAVLEGPEPIDLLFTDLVMPGAMTGIELARAARRLRPGIKLLLTSGYSSKFDDLARQPEPDFELLAKPYGYSSLTRKVGEILDDGAEAQAGSGARGPSPAGAPAPRDRRLESTG